MLGMQLQQLVNSPGGAHMGVPQNMMNAAVRRKFVVPEDQLREERDEQERRAARIAFLVARRGADVHALGRLGVEGEKAVKEGSNEFRRFNEARELGSVGRITNGRGSLGSVSGGGASSAGGSGKQTGEGSGWMGTAMQQAASGVDRATGGRTHVAGALAKANRRVDEVGNSASREKDSNDGTLRLAKLDWHDDDQHTGRPKAKAAKTVQGSRAAAAGSKSIKDGQGVDEEEGGAAQGEDTKFREGEDAESESSASELEDDRVEDSAFPAGPVPPWLTGPRRRMWMSLSVALAREKARVSLRRSRNEAAPGIAKSKGAVWDVIRRKNEQISAHSAA